MVRIIIIAVWLGAGIIIATNGTAGAGAPLEFGGQNDVAATLPSILKTVLPAVIDIEARGRVAQPATAASNAHRKTALPSKPPSLATRHDVMATGSGVVIDPLAGLIVTNNHVIDRAETITVRLADAASLTA